MSLNKPLNMDHAGEIMNTSAGSFVDVTLQDSNNNNKQSLHVI